MKFFFIESIHTFINLDNVCGISIKDDDVMVWFVNNCVNYTLTDDERKQLVHCIAQNTIN